MLVAPGPLGPGASKPQPSLRISVLGAPPIAPTLPHTSLLSSKAAPQCLGPRLRWTEPPSPAPCGLAAFTFPYTVISMGLRERRGGGCDCHPIMFGQSLSQLWGIGGRAKMPHWLLKPGGVREVGGERVLPRAAGERWWQMGVDCI